MDSLYQTRQASAALKFGPPFGFLFEPVQNSWLCEVEGGIDLIKMGCSLHLNLAVGVIPVKNLYLLLKRGILLFVDLLCQSMLLLARR